MQTLNSVALVVAAMEAETGAFDVYMKPFAGI